MRELEQELGGGIVEEVWSGGRSNHSCSGEWNR